MVAPYGICDPEMTKLFIPPMPRSRAQEGPPKASTTKCGQCHTCLNPQLKKACITFRKEQGLPPPTRKKKDGDAAVTATPAAAGALGDDTTASEGNEQPKRVYAPRVDHWAAEKGWKPRKWRKVDVHNDTLLHNNTCKLKRWAPEEYLDRLDKLRKSTNAPMTESQLSVAAAAAVVPRTGHRVGLPIQRGGGDEGGAGFSGRSPQPAGSFGLGPMRTDASSRQMLGGNSFTCLHEGCGKTFVDNAALKKHSAIHGERHHACPVEGCGKRFLDNSKLKRHMSVHSAERTFTCPFVAPNGTPCGKLFASDSGLRGHMRSHDVTERPGDNKMASFSLNDS